LERVRVFGIVAAPLEWTTSAPARPFRERGGQKSSEMLGEAGLSEDA
jgi:hypothetical protein